MPIHPGPFFMAELNYLSVQSALVAFFSDVTDKDTVNPSNGTWLMVLSGFFHH
jgi:hypothetical protein